MQNESIDENGKWLLSAVYVEQVVTDYIHTPVVIVFERDRDEGLPAYDPTWKAIGAQRGRSTKSRVGYLQRRFSQLKVRRALALTRPKLHHHSWQVLPFPRHGRKAKTTFHEDYQPFPS